MQTPFGFECTFYYEDYHRGREMQQCRLAQQSGSIGDWSSYLCKGCPIPSIQQANSCESLLLSGEVQRGFLGLARSMHVTANCTKTRVEVEEPEIGCGQCHADNPILAALMNLGQDE